MRNSKHQTEHSGSKKLPTALKTLKHSNTTLTSSIPFSRDGLLCMRMCGTQQADLLRHQNPPTNQTREEGGGEKGGGDALHHF